MIDNRHTYFCRYDGNLPTDWGLVQTEVSATVIEYPSLPSCWNLPYVGKTGKVVAVSIGMLYQVLLEFSDDDGVPFKFASLTRHAVKCSVPVFDLVNAEHLRRSNEYYSKKDVHNNEE